MQTLLERLFSISVRCLLQAYPPVFRTRFRSEMEQVYHTLACQVSMIEGWRGMLHLWLRVVLDGISGVLAQWLQLLTSRRNMKMEPDLLDRHDGTAPLTLRHAFLAVLPFLLFGLANIATHFRIFQFPQDSVPFGLMLITHPFLIFNWLVLIGLAAGFLNGFPRWSFTYLGWSILNGLWWANLSFYGQKVNWVTFPLVAVLAIPFLVRRVRRQTWEVFISLWRDLTLIALGGYILFSSVYIIYDENHHPALLFFIAASALASTVGAWGYFRTASPFRRVLALIGGLALNVSLYTWNSLTWDAAAYYGLSSSPSQSGFLAGAIFLSVMTVGMIGLAGITNWLIRRRSI